ncbi:MAG TPA: peptidoglycan recognition family protein [Puia sp.]|uniref:N-acetylmuramoyl-L-alanine amidase n=1 Tax=Puia sp. TaxID=2045100 RepID=UPI002C5F46E0|nr:peptidoglycan recognition family protein [Puia sp.]HVU95446.1 peptidoglycan recognition family protein [Puia sp.]
MNSIQKPSPNFFPGRKTYQPIAIVIHIMEGTLADTDSWFNDPASRVSAHYGVGRNGDVHQYVQEQDSAWHAGRVHSPSWQLIKPAEPGFYYNPNYYTIGIEHEGDESTEWSDATYAASSSLIRDISRRWSIPLDRNHLIGHHEIYSIKACPGGKVDLNKLISLASDPPPTGPVRSLVGNRPARILHLGAALTSTRLNIRVSPDRNQAPIATVAAGSTLPFDGYTEQGEPVFGNSKWFYTAAGQWFWSGGVK